MTASPYLGSGSRIVWPPASDAPRLADLGRGRLEDRRQGVAREVLGEGCDRQREQHAPTHREHVGQGVGGRDLAVGRWIVDERREEVEGAEDREVVGDPVGGGVVGRVEAGDQVAVLGSRTKARQRVGEEVRAELRGATAAVGEIGQADGGALAARPSAHSRVPPRGER